MSFQCDQCGMVSHNPTDEREGYCGNCHQWRSDMEGARRRKAREGLLEQMAEAMCAEGFDVETITVDTHPDAEGVKVICVSCGRMATIPYRPKGGEMICPRCIWGTRFAGAVEPPA